MYKKLIIWRDEVKMVEDEKVYNFTEVRIVRNFNSCEKVLQTTPDTVITPVTLEKAHISVVDIEEDRKQYSSSEDVQQRILTGQIAFVDSVDNYLECLQCHCKAAPWTEQSRKTILCQTCHKYVRKTDCKVAKSVRFTLVNDEEKAT